MGGKAELMKKETILTRFADKSTCVNLGEFTLIAKKEHWKQLNGKTRFSECF